MRKYWLAAALAVAVYSPQSGMGATTRELLAMCAGVGPIPGMSDINRVLCAQYISGFVDASALLRDKFRAVPPFCIPPSGMANERMMAAFVDHVTLRPDALETTPRVAVLEALAFAYPCAR